MDKKNGSYKKKLKACLSYEIKKYGLTKFTAFARYLLSFENAVIWH